ncbi:MAG: hypothetical protein EBR30_24045 [Cytophagia bacterium]|jgi:hypothetical protein|nr:hypothetical protein [Cytophagia bacterium]
MKKYNFKIGDLFVHYKDKKNMFYIQGMSPSAKEFKVYWFRNENKHSFYSEKSLLSWLHNGMFHYYPVVE